MMATIDIINNLNDLIKLCPNNSKNKINKFCELIYVRSEIDFFNKFCELIYVWSEIDFLAPKYETRVWDLGMATLAPLRGERLYVHLRLFTPSHWFATNKMNQCYHHFKS